jgi:uncharacterized membrane protein YhaH (DUF805 family)
VSFPNAIRTVLTKYAVLDGRAARPEFWYFTIAYTLVYLVLVQANHATGSSWPTTILSVALFLPGLGVAVRRLHDTDRSGWWILIGVVPFIGLILLIYFVHDGTAGENAYGPDPKGR